MGLANASVRSVKRPAACHLQGAMVGASPPVKMAERGGMPRYTAVQRSSTCWPKNLNISHGRGSSTIATEKFRNHCIVGIHLSTYCSVSPHAPINSVLIGQRGDSSCWFRFHFISKKVRHTAHSGKVRKWTRHPQKKNGCKPTSCRTPRVTTTKNDKINIINNKNNCSDANYARIHPGTHIYIYKLPLRRGVILTTTPE